MRWDEQTLFLGGLFVCFMTWHWRQVLTAGEHAAFWVVFCKVRNNEGKHEKRPQQTRTHGLDKNWLQEVYAVCRLTSYKSDFFN